MDLDFQKLSPYLCTLRTQPPSVVRPVTINICNPLNPAKSHPLLHSTVDAGAARIKTHFPIKTTQHDVLNSAALVAAALKPRATKRLATFGSSSQAYPLSQIDIAPGRKALLSAFERDEPPDGETSQSGTLTKRKRAENTGRDNESPAKRRKDTQAPRSKQSRPNNPPVESQQGKSQITDRNVSKSAQPPRLSDLTRTIGQVHLPVPTTLENAMDADKMLVGWKAQKKSWPEIVAEWTRLTGQDAHHEDLIFRGFDLHQSLISNGDYDNMIVRIKRMYEDQPAPPELWERVCQKLDEDHNVCIWKEVCRRRYFHVINQRGYEHFDVHVDDEIEDHELELHRDYIGVVTFPGVREKGAYCAEGSIDMAMRISEA